MTEQITPNVKKITSRQFTIDFRDLLRGAALTAITSVLTYLVNAFSDSTFVFQWKPVGKVALVTIMGYLLRNFFEPAKTMIEIKPPIDNAPPLTDKQIIDTVKGPDTKKP